VFGEQIVSFRVVALGSDTLNVKFIDPPDKSAEHPFASVTAMNSTLHVPAFTLPDGAE
jgi:hypothetical protein